MMLPHGFRRCRQGRWTFIVQPQHWSEALKDRVLALVERQTAAKHPQTLEMCGAVGSGSDHFYLKVFHARGGIFVPKELFRRSKAFHSLRINAALADAGFDVPGAIAAGEQRRHGRLRRAFVLSPAIDGVPAPVFLRNRYGSTASQSSLAEKRLGLKQLAELVSRLHRLGFVHGDLVPSNLLVSETAGGIRFVFMDNDRTRRFPPWLQGGLWRRNLVQLNRFPLPGITLQDRVRFFRFYRGDRDRPRADKRLLKSLEMKTRRRRRECDGIDATGDFRTLMRWQETAAARPERNPLRCDSISAAGKIS
jgi:hypothetical protein